jgi:hypothetical protein
VHAVVVVPERAGLLVVRVPIGRRLADPGDVAGVAVVLRLGCGSVQVRRRPRRVVMVSVPPPRPSRTGGVVKGSVYGAVIFFDEILDAVLARTVRSKGRASGAAPSADTVSASRRDMIARSMTLPIPTLYLRERGSLLRAPLRSRAWGVAGPPTSGDAAVVRVGGYE